MDTVIAIVLLLVIAAGVAFAIWSWRKNKDDNGRRHGGGKNRYNGGENRYNGGDRYGIAGRVGNDDRGRD